MLATGELIATDEALQQNLGREQFLGLLGANPEVLCLPDVAVVHPNDTFKTYVDRVRSADIPTGIYMTDPKIGKVLMPDTAEGPNEFKKLLPDEEIETKGVASNNGFFAHTFVNPDGSIARLAFRPFDPKLNENPLEDFAKNMIVRHLGLESTQTVGFYVGPGGVGGTISLLDDEIRSLDQFSTQKLKEPNEQGETVFEQIARELAFAHEVVGITQGDIALRNIMQRQDGGLFFIDWGRAEPIRQSESGATITGTPEHDVGSLFHDFVWLRPSTDRNAEARSEYRSFLEREFFAPYIKWRRLFNDAKTRQGGKMSNTELDQELARITSKLPKM